MVARPDTSARPSGWQLDAGSAEAYERILVPLLAPWADRLLDLVAPRPGERVLDVGCGTGLVARRVAPRVAPRGTVTGLDLNEAMLDVARTVAADVHPAIEWRQGNAEDLPFPHAAFDVVCSHQVLQFVPDPAAALREMRRVLAPGGRLGLGVMRAIAHTPVYAKMAEVVARHLGPAAGATIGSPFPAWDRAHLRDLVAGAGFRDARLLIQIDATRVPSAELLLRGEAASSPLAGAIEALDPAALAALIGDLDEALRAHADDDGLAFALETWLVVAPR